MNTLDTRTKTQKKVRIIGWSIVSLVSYILLRSLWEITWYSITSPLLLGDSADFNLVSLSMDTFITLGMLVGFVLVFIAVLISGLGLIKNKEWARVMTIKSLWGVVGLFSIYSLFAYLMIKPYTPSFYESCSFDGITMVVLVLSLGLIFVTTIVATFVTWLFNKKEYIDSFESGEWV